MAVVLLTYQRLIVDMSVVKIQPLNKLRVDIKSFF